MFTIKRDSWHYRMYQLAKPSRRHPSDFCQYSSSVFGGLIFFISATALIAAISGILLLGFYELVLVAAGSLSMNYAEFAQFTVAAIFGAIIFAGVCWLLVVDYQKLSGRFNETLDRAGFIGTWFKSIRQKMCIPVKMQD